ncbi:MAG: DUF3800 domain-containing protein [Proteobacteria bacterium]|nr:DUF3800 domain-containing protein [Pseudomonadota bacterium]
MYRLYIDETGNSDEKTSNDPELRYLSLTGIVIKEQVYSNSIIPKFNALRSRYFTHSSARPIVLHRTDMSRKKGIYACLKDFETNASWESDFMHFLAQQEYHVITTTIDKIAFYYKYPNWRGNPYNFCAFNLLERYYYFLRHSGARGYVTAESRGEKKDKPVKKAYDKFYTSGSYHLSNHEVQARFAAPEIDFKEKNDDIIGVQLADMIAKPALSHSKLYFKSIDDFNPRNRFQKNVALTVHPKFYRSPAGKLSGYGLVWRPK